MVVFEVSYMVAGLVAWKVTEVEEMSQSIWAQVDNQAKPAVEDMS